MTNSEQTSVLISGGNKGLGFEAARRLGKQGWTILPGSRDESRGRGAADKLTDGGANVVVVPLDVTSDESVTDAVRLVREHTDRLDVLINYAGVPGRGITTADATAGEIHSVYDTNVYGPIRVTYAFLPLLQAADHSRVVMVSSGGGSFTVVTDPEQPSSRIHELAYSSSKVALNMITVRYAQAKIRRHRHEQSHRRADGHRGHRLDRQTRDDRYRRVDMNLHRSPWPRCLVTAAQPTSGRRGGTQFGQQSSG